VQIVLEEGLKGREGGVVGGRRLGLALHRNLEAAPARCRHVVLVEAAGEEEGAVRVAGEPGTRRVGAHVAAVGLPQLVRPRVLGHRVRPHAQRVGRRRVQRVAVGGGGRRAARAHVEQVRLLPHPVDRRPDRLGDLADQLRLSDQRAGQGGVRNTPTPPPRRCYHDTLEQSEKAL
jgi:hypothetical protein